MQSLIYDIGFAWRNALKNPGTSALIVVTLALGIGVNSAVFSMTWRVLLAPLPYADSASLVKLQQHSRDSGSEFGWSGPTIADFRAQEHVFADVAGYLQLPFTVVGGAGPRQISAGVVSWNFLAMLGVRPVIGRTFTASDDMNGAAPVLLLAEDFWRDEFSADPAVVGTSLVIKDIAYTVIGVLPHMPPWPHDNAIWIPAASDPYRLYAWTDGYETRGGTWTALVLARVNEGLVSSQVQSALDATAARLKAAYPDDYPDGYAVTPDPIQREITGDSSATFWMLSGLAFIVALIASGNVAGLNMASLAARNQELAIREAVGASPGRLVRQVLTENLLLAGIGCMLAIAIAWPALRLLEGFALEFTPLASGMEMDASVVAFALVIALMMWLLSTASVLSGQRNVNRALKDGGDKSTVSRSAAWRRQALLTAQFALAFIALCCASLMVSSLERLNGQHGGYEPRQVMAASLMIDVDFGEREQSQAPYADVMPYYRTFSETLLAELRATPGMEAAGLLAGVPLLQNLSYLGAVTFDIEGLTFSDPSHRASAPYHAATEGLFEALRVPLLQGRLFAETDDANSLPVALVNASFARAYFPQGNALGQRIRMLGDPTWRTVVGVVGDLRSEGRDRVEGPAAYYNYWQYPTEVVTVYMNTAESLETVEQRVGSIVRGIQPRQSVESVAPLEAIEAQWLAPLSLRTALIVLFGVLALVITLSGVIGVVSYNVSQRVREIGVHMAVGANPGRVIGIFVFQGLRIYSCGLALGLALALLAAPQLQPLLYETSVFDPVIHAAVILLLTLVVLAAMYFPARRAGVLSPVEALHAE